MVKVKLAADCIVKKEVRKKDEVVSLPKEIAEFFGTVVPDQVPPPAPKNDQGKPDDK